jgi:hypothetical protein
MFQTSKGGSAAKTTKLLAAFGQRLLVAFGQRKVGSTPRHLLAAFLTTFGKTEVAQHAQRFLGPSLGLDFDATGPELSSQVGILPSLRKVWLQVHCNQRL